MPWPGIITAAAPSISAEFAHLAAASRSARPWKNGGGQTSDVLVWPPGADLADFDWRISLAEVASDGPFSLFPGVDRSLAVVEGDGLYLAVGGRERLLTTASSPCSFPGDVASAARLRGGRVKDLNVMSRRQRYRHQLVRLAPALLPGFTAAPGPSVLLWLGDAATVTTPGGSARVGRFDALFCSLAGRWSIAAAAPAAGFLITIAPMA